MLRESSGNISLRPFEDPPHGHMWLVGPPALRFLRWDVALWSAESSPRRRSPHKVQTDGEDEEWRGRWEQTEDPLIASGSAVQRPSRRTVTKELQIKHVSRSGPHDFIKILPCLDSLHFVPHPPANKLDPVVES